MTLTSAGPQRCMRNRRSIWSRESPLVAPKAAHPSSLLPQFVKPLPACYPTPVYSYLIYILSSWTAPLCEPSSGSIVDDRNSRSLRSMPVPSIQRASRIRTIQVDGGSQGQDPSVNPNPHASHSSETVSPVIPAILVVICLILIATIAWWLRRSLRWSRRYLPLLTKLGFGWRPELVDVRAEAPQNNSEGNDGWMDFTVSSTLPAS
ncbi:hypothetical protein C8Q78DRAFT_632350 [Trametes maxima]|nr:hypothetical protein C8Q78DRAFT_632350 [Trametes maxima]